MLFIIAMGIGALFSIPKEMFPEFEFDTVIINVPYPGASPMEIEEGICIKIEEAVNALDGIGDVYSTSLENMGQVVIEIKDGFDKNEIFDDIKAEIDRIDTFPEEAEDPVLMIPKRKIQVVTLALAGNVSEKSLKTMASDIEDELKKIPGVSQTEVWGLRDYEISIEIPWENLEKYSISIENISKIIRSSSLDLPGGNIKTRHGEVLIRTIGQKYTRSDFENIIILNRPDGTKVRLKDIGRVQDGFSEQMNEARLEGRKSAMINVYKNEQGDAVTLAAKIEQYVKDRKFPPGISLSIWRDLTSSIKDRLDLLKRNALSGLILVFIALALFLDIKLSFWVVLGLPVAFLGTFAVMNIQGITLNMISMFGLIMVLGILVDDSIVVAENVYEKIKNKKDQSVIEAAVQGTYEMFWPVIASVSTTIAAFCPLFFIKGTMGKFIKEMPVIVISALVLSLVEALIILPNHLAHAYSRIKNGSGQSRFRTFMDSKTDYFISKIYQPFLRLVLTYRYVFAFFSVTLIVLAAGAVKFGFIKFVGFPKTDSDMLICQVLLPEGASYEETKARILHIEDAARRINPEIKKRFNEKKLPIQSIFSVIGEQGQSNRASCYLTLNSASERNIISDRIAQIWREKTGQLPDVLSLVFPSARKGPGGKAFSLSINGPDYEVLTKVKERIKQELRQYPALNDIDDDLRPGKMEIKIKIKDSARLLGVTIADLARQVRNAFYGHEANRIQRGRDDIRVLVRYDQEHRKTLGDIYNIKIRTADNREIPILETADITLARGYSALNRLNRSRTVTISADVNVLKGNAEEIIADLNKNILPGIRQEISGWDYLFTGQKKENALAIQSGIKGFAIAFLAVFAILAAVFKSYMQPFIIILTVPFGIIGAVAGHFIMGYSLTLMSLFGFVALTGIVVNDSLVFIDCVNTILRQTPGITLFEALTLTGKRRFNAILLTTVTTVAGLVPMLYEQSIQAIMLIPMAISIAFGIMFATMLTLVFIPCAYHILFDILNVWSRLWNNKDLSAGDFASTE
jgi:multidrug efflux pump subunit AcrB